MGKPEVYNDATSRIHDAVVGDEGDARRLRFVYLVEEWVAM